MWFADLTHNTVWNHTILNNFQAPILKLLCSASAAYFTNCISRDNNFVQQCTRVFQLFCLKIPFLLCRCCIHSPVGKCEVIYDAIIILWQILWFIVLLFNQLQACIYIIGPYIRFKWWRKKDKTKKKKKKNPPNQCDVVNCVNLLHLFSITPMAESEKGSGSGGESRNN